MSQPDITVKLDVFSMNSDTYGEQMAQITIGVSNVKTITDRKKHSHFHDMYVFDVVDNPLAKLLSSRAKRGLIDGEFAYADEYNDTQYYMKEITDTKTKKISTKLYSHDKKLLATIPTSHEKITIINYKETCHCSYYMVTNVSPKKGEPLTITAVTISIPDKKMIAQHDITIPEIHHECDCCTDLRKNITILYSSLCPIQCILIYRDKLLKIMCPSNGLQIVCSDERFRYCLSRIYFFITDGKCFGLLPHANIMQMVAMGLKNIQSKPVTH